MKFESLRPHEDWGARVAFQTPGITSLDSPSGKGRKEKEKETEREKRGDKEREGKPPRVKAADHFSQSVTYV